MRQPRDQRRKTQTTDRAIVESLKYLPKFDMNRQTDRGDMLPRHLHISGSQSIDQLCIAGCPS